MKPCGECRECCKVFPVPVLKKPAGVWCQFACASGCSVHGPAMPAICRAYDCYWRDHDLHDALRPDRLGIVITEAGTLSVGYHFLPALILQVAAPEALEMEMGQKILRDLVAEGFAAVVIKGDKAEIHFDSKRYKNASAEEIEVALRQQFGNDADELIQLGAAPPDYDPLTEAP